MPEVIRISAGDDDEELRSFYGWLQDDPEVRHHALVTMEPRVAGEGEMGSGLDAVTLVIDTGFQLLNLALAYLAWRATRSSPSPMTIERDGVRITLDDADPEVVGQILRALEK